MGFVVRCVDVRMAAWVLWSGVWMYGWLHGLCGQVCGCKDGCMGFVEFTSRFA